MIADYSLLELRASIREILRGTTIMPESVQLWFDFAHDQLFAYLVLSAGVAWGSDGEGAGSMPRWRSVPPPFACHRTSPSRSGSPVSASSPSPPSSPASASLPSSSPVPASLRRPSAVGTSRCESQSPVSPHANLRNAMWGMHKEENRPGWFKMNRLEPEMGRTRTGSAHGLCLVLLRADEFSVSGVNL